MATKSKVKKNTENQQIAVLSKGNRIMLIVQPTKTQVKDRNKRKWNTISILSADNTEELQKLLGTAVSECHKNSKKEPNQ